MTEGRRIRKPPSRELMLRAMEEMEQTLGGPLPPWLITEAWKQFDLAVQEYEEQIRRDIGR